MNAFDISDEMYKLVRAYGVQEYQRGRSDMYKEMLEAIKALRDSFRLENAEEAIE